MGARSLGSLPGSRDSIELSETGAAIKVLLPRRLQSGPPFMNARVRVNVRRWASGVLWPRLRCDYSSCATGRSVCSSKV
jgi:hypothetical protein